MQIQSNDKDEKLTEYFLSEVAGFLKNIESLYRELKLKKKVWEKITPVILQYMVGRSFLHALEYIQLNNASMEKDSINPKLSTEEYNICANDVNACLSELSSVNARHFEIYPKLCTSFQVVCQQLQNKSSKQLLETISKKYLGIFPEANVTNVCYAPNTFKDTLSSDQHIETVESTTFVVNNDSSELFIPPSDKIFQTVTSFNDSLCAENGATLEQVDTLLEFFETYSVALMTKNL
jgi:hypothetical protein